MQVPRIFANHTSLFIGDCAVLLAAITRFGKNLREMVDLPAVQRLNSLESFRVGTGRTIPRSHLWRARFSSSKGYWKGLLNPSN